MFEELEQMLHSYELEGYKTIYDHTVEIQDMTNRTVVIYNPWSTIYRIFNIQPDWEGNMAVHSAYMTKFELEHVFNKDIGDLISKSIDE